ncbi:MAG: nucleotidyltransferase family protein [Acidobacteriota bacterium]
MVKIGPIEIDREKLAEICHRYQVRELSVFGSAVHGALRPDSDVDFLVEFLPQAEIGLLEFAGLMLDLSALIGRKVDLVSKGGIKPLIRHSVLAEAQPVYAA